MRALVLVALSLVISPIATAAVEVTVTAGNLLSWSVTPGTIPGSVKVYAKVEGVPSGFLFVQATTPGTVIEEIAVEPFSNVFTPDTMNVLLFVQPKPNTSGTITYLGNVGKLGNDGDLWIAQIFVQGTIGNPAAPHATFVGANSVNVIEATGTIASDIISAGSAQQPGNVARVESLTGSLIGDIQANGRIEIFRSNQTIGSATNSVLILSNTGLWNLQGSSIWADVDANLNNGTGHIRRIAATTGGFTGTINGSNLDGPGATDGLSVAGALNANMLFEGSVLDPITAGSLPAGKTMWITGSLTDDATTDGRINLGANGLAGQVIINSNNTGGSWTGDVTIGTTILSPEPNYAPKASDIGGGAVGLAPYRLHAEDCTPPSGSSMAGGLITGSSVTLRHYGPVDWATGIHTTPEPVKVEYRLQGGTTWYDITDDFDVTHGANPRDIVVTALTGLDFDALVEYRITPVTTGANMLKCAGLTVSGNVPVTPYVYTLVP